MPSDGRKYKAVERSLSRQDRLFVKLVVDAEIPRAQAFRIAYPEHKSVQRYVDAVKAGVDKELRHRLSVLVSQAMKTKLQTNYIQNAVVNYQDAMDRLANKSLEVAEDLLENGRSEKVRADLATEFIRHKVGTPTQKVAVKEEKTVYLTFGKPPKEREVIDM